jgi:hypothetical protein
MNNVHIAPGSVGASVGFRAGLATEMAAKILQQDARDKPIKEYLLNTAPPSVREWIHENGVIDDLFHYGFSSRQMRFGEPLNDSAHVLGVCAQLAKAWKGLVRVTVSSNPEPHRVEIFFSATRL